MPAGRRSFGFGLGAIAVLSVLGCVPLGPGVGLALPPDPVTETRTPWIFDSINVTVVPSRWWIPAGNSTPVLAEWSGAPPGCTADPLWFHWSIPSGTAQGGVTPGTGAEVTFAADPGGSGTTDLTVVSAAMIDCGNRSSAVLRNATATFQVDSPPNVREIETDPNPAGPGASVSLGGEIAGGEPPYDVVVHWSGSDRTQAQVEGAGPFELGHALAPGVYAPVVVVTDAAGLSRTVTAPGPVTVGDGFAIALGVSSELAEVGLPVDFTVRSDVPGPNYSTVANCPDSTGSIRPAVIAGVRFSCTFVAPGVANVSAYAMEAGPPYGNASTYYREQVAPPLSVSAPAEVPDAEQGTPILVPVTVTGGVPPFVLSWRCAGNGSEGIVTDPSDGTFRVPVLPIVAGSETLQLQAVDAVNVSVTNASALLDVAPTIAVEALANGSVANRAPWLGINATVLAGVPPFLWAVVSIQTVPAGGGGTLDAPGTFGWNGSGSIEGPLTATLFVVDGSSATWSVPCTATPTPPVSLVVGPPSVASGHWSAAVVVDGGIPPYEIWVNDSSGDSVNRSDPGAGTFDLGGPCPVAGNLSVDIVAVDGFGAVARSSFVAIVPASPHPQSRAVSDGSVGAVVLAAVGGAGLGWFLWRHQRRRRREAPPLPDPVGTLREIIAPADGADRATVELLAEEQGVPFEEVRSTIDRLVGEGTIRSERGPDGEEILAWREPR